MGFKVSWHIPNRVYRMQVWGEISLEDLKQGSDAASKFICKGTAPVHCIGDARYVRKIPLNFGQVKVATQVLQEPNLGYFLFLSNNPIFKVVGSAVSHMSNVKFSTYDSPDILISVLQNLDPSLPSLPPYTFTAPSADE